MFNRGEVWIVDLEPVVGHEQGGRPRPAVILSSDDFNNGPAELVTIVPLTRTDRQIPLHVLIDPPEGGLTSRSSALCDNIRTVSTARLKQRLGSVSAATLDAIVDRIRILLDL